MATSPKIQCRDLRGKVAVVTGGSRGIGRETCLALARAGCNIAVCAKSITDTKDLPGTIYSVAKECIEAGKAHGVEAIGVRVDLRDVDNCAACIEEVAAKWGRVDILVNNASALWWQDITDTPMNKYDLITSINSRGTFAITKACLPWMTKNNFGRVICMSPPINTSLPVMAGHTAYNISKYGMTMVALGVAGEFIGEGITGNSLWPATVVESQASINFKLGDQKDWRKATILADCVMSIVSEPDTFTGHQLIDDTYLLSTGLTPEDLAIYRCDPSHEPLRALDQSAPPPSDVVDYRTMAKRGDVKQLEKDLATSTGRKKSRL